jgi:hypothetical protein
MRSFRSVLAVGALLLLAGCNGSKWGLIRTAQQPIPTEVPTKGQLIAYLNGNAQHIRGLQCRYVDLDCQYRHQPVGLRGRLDCQKPHDFRLTADLVGSRAVDIGSSNEEFWFWISKAEPPHLYHCSYEDFSRGVRLPFPFQPEWIMEALGMAEYGPESKYQLDVKDKTLELWENTKTPQGQAVRKVIVFNRAGAAVQVPAYELRDSNGRVICSAQISEVQTFAVPGAGSVFVPKRVRLIWPAEQMQLKLVLNDLTLNPPLDPQMSARLFSRPTLANVQAYDLARGLGAGPGQVRPAGGLIQQ